VRKADNLTTILGHCHVIWEPKLPGTLWAPRTCNGTDLPLPYSGYQPYFQQKLHWYISVQQGYQVVQENAKFSDIVSK